MKLWIYKSRLHVWIVFVTYKNRTQCVMSPIRKDAVMAALSLPFKKGVKHVN